jgi:SAM-dependent MidA family methyltransferase
MARTEEMTELDKIIRAEIRSSGPMRFDRFMELALYHSDFGYYAQIGKRSQTGRSGDFFTSVSVGPLFGRLLARQFFQMWEALGSPRPFGIVEQGAHDGRLMCDVLEWCRAETPEFFEAIRYGVVESSPAACAVQRELAEKTGVAGSLTWFDRPASLDEWPVGIFFSNELVDAFPVRVIACHVGQWQEKCVGVDEEEALTWVTREIEDRELARVVETLSLPLIEGYTTEINWPAHRWMKEVASVVKRGYVLTIDYGFPASVYYAPFRTGGTLTAYLNHQRSDEVLAEPGMRDLTAHVDFTALARAGEEGGLTALGFVDQQRFLMGIAANELGGKPGPLVRIQENLRAWNTLTHPEYLGARFQVLLQLRHAPANLDGLQFARPGGVN